MTAAAPTARKKAPFAVAALAGIGLISAMLLESEGMVTTTYKDVVNITTFCVGETNKKFLIKQRFTRAECMNILDASVQEKTRELAKCVTAPVTVSEAAAIVSWSYNVGTPAACKSGLVKKLNAGTTSAVWCRDLLKWIYAGGKVWPGLVRRRQDEYAVCVGSTPSRWPAAPSLALAPANDTVYQPLLRLTPKLAAY